MWDAGVGVAISPGAIVLSRSHLIRRGFNQHKARIAMGKGGKKHSLNAKSKNANNKFQVIFAKYD
jgi:hypothetical protein